MLLEVIERGLPIDLYLKELQLHFPRHFLPERTMQTLEKIIREKTSGRNPLLAGTSLGAASISGLWTSSSPLGYIASVWLTRLYSGEFEYSHVAGPLSVTPGSRPLKEDDVFWIASCTKLLTTICMLQCIEEGLFILDQDITTVLPEWKDPDILTGFDEITGGPILKKAKNKITIR